MWGPVGCFLWRNRRSENHIINLIAEESSKERNNWPPIKAGLFDGSFERFQQVGKKYIEFFSKIPRF